MFPYPSWLHEPAEVARRAAQKAATQPDVDWPALAALAELVAVSSTGRVVDVSELAPTALRTASALLAGLPSAPPAPDPHLARSRWYEPGDDERLRHMMWAKAASTRRSTSPDHSNPDGAVATHRDHRCGHDRSAVGLSLLIVTARRPVR